MLDGNLPKGFELFEWRWAAPPPTFPLPARNGMARALDGLRLILFMEQGLGDMLQFCATSPSLRRLRSVRITAAGLAGTAQAAGATLPGVEAIHPIAPPYPPPTSVLDHEPAGS